MGRNIKEGLSYFPLDVDFFEDDKLKFVEARFMEKGELIAVKLLCKIFKAGYYIKWDDDMTLLFSSTAGKNISPGLANDVVNELIKRDFFNKSLFERFAILTSRGIQKRYTKICTDSRRKDWQIDAEIDLLRSKKAFTPEEITKTPEESAQRKEKERKEKESKVWAHDAPTDSKIVFKKLSIPTVNEVKDYFLSTIGNSKNEKSWPEDKCSNEAATFIDHYTANGWVQARGKPIKDWQAACRNWIRNGLKGTFDKKDIVIAKPKEANPVRKDQNGSTDKILLEINYLFERFLEGQVTVISVEPIHYDYLKRTGQINFSDEQKAEIKKQSIEHIKNKSLPDDDNNVLKFMKMFGVLEYFKSKSLAPAQ